MMDILMYTAQQEQFAGLSERPYSRRFTALSKELLVYTLLTFTDAMVQ